MTSNAIEEIFGDMTSKHQMKSGKQSFPAFDLNQKNANYYPLTFSKYWM
jgi:hypothetical protein